METRASHVAVGAFVLVLLGGLVAFILWLERVSIDAGGDRYLIYFTDSVAGLQGGASVRYRGLFVGRVLTIDINPENVEQVRVLIEVEAGTPIVEGNVASLESLGLTGGQAIQISGGVAGAPPLAPRAGERLPVIPAVPGGGGLTALLNQAPQVLARVNELLDEAGAVLSAENREAISAILGNLRAISEAGAEGAQAVSNVIERLSTLALTLEMIAFDLRDDVARLTAEAESSLGQAGADLTAVASAFLQTAGRIDSLVADVSPGLTEFTNSGLYDLSLAIAELRILAATLNRTAVALERDGLGALIGDTDQGRRID